MFHIFVVIYSIPVVIGLFVIRKFYMFPSNMRFSAISIKEKMDYYQVNYSVLSNYTFKSDFGNNHINEYDYYDIRYQISFTKYFNDISQRYYNYNKQFNNLPSYIHTGDLMVDNSDSTKEYPTMLVIGSDFKQFHCMLATVIKAITRTEFSAITLIDYGWKEENFDELAHYIGDLRRLSKHHIQFYYRKFDFSKTPTWISLQECATKGGHSWKVISNIDCIRQWNGFVVLLDTGIELPPTFEKEKEYARNEGIYSPRSHALISNWTYPSTIDFFRLHIDKYIDKYIDKPNCLSAYVIVNTRNTTIMNEVIDPYFKCALTKKCIRPINSSRSNHRFEQTILSLLIQRIHIPHSASKLSFKMPPYRRNRKRNDALEYLKTIISE